MARRMSAFVGKQTSLIRSPMSANDPQGTRYCTLIFTDHAREQRSIFIPYCRKRATRVLRYKQMW